MVSLEVWEVIMSLLFLLVMNFVLCSFIELLFLVWMLFFVVVVDVVLLMWNVCIVSCVFGLLIDCVVIILIVLFWFIKWLCVRLWL